VVFIVGAFIASVNGFWIILHEEQLQQYFV
jgi:hypothetical protein